MKLQFRIIEDDWDGTYQIVVRNTSSNVQKLQEWVPVSYVFRNCKYDKTSTFWGARFRVWRLERFGRIRSEYTDRTGPNVIWESPKEDDMRWV